MRSVAPNDVQFRMLRRLSLTLKDQKQAKRAQRQVRGAAVPYHEPTSSDDDNDEDDDVDDDVSTPSLHDVMSAAASPSTEMSSWSSTPSTPTTPSLFGQLPPPLELSARTLLWSRSLSSSPPSPAVYLPQSAASAAGGLVRPPPSLTLVALAESGDVDGLKAALKVDASSVNNTDEVSLTV